MHSLHNAPLKIMTIEKQVSFPCSATKYIKHNFDSGINPPFGGLLN